MSSFFLYVKGKKCFFSSPITCELEIRPKNSFFRLTAISIGRHKSYDYMNTEPFFHTARSSLPQILSLWLSKPFDANLHFWTPSHPHGSVIKPPYPVHRAYSVYHRSDFSMRIASIMGDTRPQVFFSGGWLSASCQIGVCFSPCIVTLGKKISTKRSAYPFFIF